MMMNWHSMMDRLNLHLTHNIYNVAVIVWWMDLQLPMQSVHITTDVVSSNLDQGEVYNITW